MLMTNKASIVQLQDVMRLCFSSHPARRLVTGRQVHTMQTAKLEVQQLIDDNLIPSVRQKVDHHAAVSVRGGKPVRGVVLEAAKNSMLVRSAQLSALPTS